MTIENIPEENKGTGTADDYKTIVSKLGAMLERMEDLTSIDTSDMKRVVDSRISWDDYFMGMAYLSAQRSSCIRRGVGAVAVKDRRIIATGYNGVPSGFGHCTKETCIRSKLSIPSGQLNELCFAVHAEQNLLVQAATAGVTSLEGSVIYCTTFPCTTCAKLLVSCKIAGLYYSEGYPDSLSAYMLKQCENQNPQFVLKQLLKPSICV